MKLNYETFLKLKYQNNKTTYITNFHILKKIQQDNGN